MTEESLLGIYKGGVLVATGFLCRRDGIVLSVGHILREPSNLKAKFISDGRFYETIIRDHSLPTIDNHYLDYSILQLVDYAPNKLAVELHDGEILDGRGYLVPGIRPNGAALEILPLEGRVVGKTRNVTSVKSGFSFRGQANEPLWEGTSGSPVFLSGKLSVFAIQTHITSRGARHAANRTHLLTPLSRIMERPLAKKWLLPPFKLKIRDATFDRRNTEFSRRSVIVVYPPDQYSKGSLCPRAPPKFICRES